MTMIRKIALKTPKTFQTEEEVQAELRKLYAIRAKIRKEKYEEYRGKSYLINGAYYFINGIFDKSFEVLIVDDMGIRLEEMQTPIEQWTEYEVSNDVLIKALESRVDVFIQTIKEKQ